MSVMRILSTALVLVAVAVDCSRGDAGSGPARVENALKQENFASAIRSVDAGSIRHHDIIPGSASSRSRPADVIVQRIVRRHLREARVCYDAESSRNPGLEGRITVRFTIGAKGQVLTSALLSSTIGNAEVEHCLVELVKKISFPKPLGGGPSSHTFHFSPSKALEVP
jgi:TonB family protein